MVLFIPVAVFQKATLRLRRNGLFDRAKESFLLQLSNISKMQYEPKL